MHSGMLRNLFQRECSFCFALLDEKRAMAIHVVAMEERWLNPRPTFGNENSCEETDLGIQGDR
jgi:hypothetical protein